jgi:hypothetical protein
MTRLLHSTGVGAHDERELDERFAPDFDIEYASRADQKRGIERWLTRDGVMLTVEIKADLHTHATETALIETVSVNGSQGRREVSGWTLTSEADLLLYYLPVTQQFYVLPMAEVRDALCQWERRYSRRKLVNGWYNSWGWVVPLRELEKMSIAIKVA